MLKVIKLHIYNILLNIYNIESYFNNSISNFDYKTFNILFVLQT